MHASLRREVQSNLLLGGPGRLVLAAEADDAGGEDGRDLVQALTRGEPVGLHARAHAVHRSAGLRFRSLSERYADWLVTSDCDAEDG
jgi:hypothetical protein